MPLQDNKIDINTIMCWDEDGRLNTDIFPGGLKVNKVSDILSEIEDLALIKGLIYNDERGKWKQYCKFNGSLYLMTDELKRLRQREKRAKVSIPIFEEIKKYLKSEGFTWDTENRCYEAPTDKLEKNTKAYYEGEDEDSSYAIKEPIEDYSVWFSPTQKYFFREVNRSSLILYGDFIDVHADISKYKDDSRKDFINNSIIEVTAEDFAKGFEMLKKDWEEYKNALPARLDMFEKNVEKYKPILQITESSIYEEARKYGFERSNVVVKYPFKNFDKTYPLENNYYMRCSVLIPSNADEYNKYKITYAPHYALWKKGSTTPLWDGYKDWHWAIKSNDETKPYPLELLVSVLGVVEDWDKEAKDTFEGCAKEIEKKMKDFEDALKDEEIGFNGHESFSMNEALKRLKDID